MLEIQVKNNDLNKKIVNFINKIYPSLSVVYLMKCTRLGKIKVNNKKIKHNYLLQLGDVIQLYLNPELLKKSNNVKQSETFTAAKDEIEIVYEDQNIIVVNKPVGLSSQPDKWSLSDSLIQRIQKYLFNKKEFLPDKENHFSPQLCNRIDRNTQGLVIGAKNNDSLNIMNEKIKNREIDKYYLCKIHGAINPPQGQLVDYLVKDEKENGVYINKKQLNSNYSKIVTQYKVVDSDNTNNDILEIKLITGKKHQIRAHLNFYGHPLFGEQRYTRKEYHDKSEYQQLYSYKIVFSFTTNSGILEYLKGKVVELNRKDIIEKLKNAS